MSSNFSLHHFNTNTILEFSFFSFICFCLKKSSCSISHENCLKIVCFMSLRKITNRKYIYLLVSYFCLASKTGHFITFLVLTNCSQCNPKVHNDKKIRLFSFFFTQVGNGKIVFIGWTLKVFSYFSQIQLPLSS